MDWIVSQFSYSCKWEFSDVIKIIHLIDVINIVILYNYYSTTVHLDFEYTCIPLVYVIFTT